MDLQTILSNLLYLMCLVILGILLVYIKGKIGDLNFENLIKMIDQLVFAKEQTITGKGMGAERKKEVMETLIDVNPAGLPKDVAVLDDLVEGRVYLMNAEKKGEN